jgi:ribonuclease BN (tRNA processing enzyme)
MNARMTRREALTRMGGIAASCAMAAGRPETAFPDRRQASTQSGGRHRTRAILLGTAGGPTPKRGRAAPANVVLVDDVPYVVDCGNGVARQLVLAGISLPSLRSVLITHHHSDHNADYGTLLLLAWASGLKSAVDTYGPPPLTRMTGLALELHAEDIRVRIRDEGRVPLKPLIRPHEVSGPGPVFQDERVRVTAALVRHPLMPLAFAYRFDGPDRSIVFSGDTARSDDLVKLAAGADVLVHEAFYAPAADRLAAGDPGASTLKKHLMDSHTSVDEAGRAAARAGVKTLVLNHFVPGDQPPVSDEEWLAGARAHFNGNVIVGRDLLEI